MKRTAYFSNKRFRSLLGTASFGTIVTISLQLLDNVIAGYLLSADAASAVSLTLPAYSLAAFICGLISIGTPILYLRKIGELKEIEADKTFSHGLISAIGLGIILSVAISFGTETYLDFYGASDAPRAYASEYFFWYRIVALILPVFMYLSEVIYADGDHRICIISHISQMTSHVIFSLILGSYFGITGIAVGVLLSLSLSIFILIHHFYKKTNGLQFYWYFNPRYLWESAKLSLTDAEVYLAISLFTAIMNKFVIDHLSDNYLILIAIIVAINGLTLIFDGVGAAITQLVGVYLGESNDVAVKHLMKRAVKVSVSEGIVFSVILYFFADYIPYLYGLTENESSQLIQECISGVKIISLSMIFVSLLYLFSSYYLILGKTALSVFICFLRDIAISAPLGIIFCLWFGVKGLFYGVMLAPVLAVIISSLVIFFRFGKERFPWLLFPNYQRKIFNFDIKVNSASIIKLRDEIANVLKEHQHSEHTITNIMLLIEEFYHLLIEKNPEEELVSECTLMLGSTTQLIIKDNGVIFDITDPDNEITSFRSMIVADIMEYIPTRANILTTGYNRNIFIFKSPAKVQN